MAPRNAFCGIMDRVNGTYLYFVPEENGGRKLRFEDVDEYLNQLRFSYDKIEVNRIISELNTERDYCLSPKKLDHPIDEMMLVKIDSERKSAVCKFYPASQGGSSMNREDIIHRLTQYGVRFGVVDGAVESFLHNRTYCTEMVLAKALPPQEGKSAEIIYNFNTNINLKPKVNEDGSVDFHNLDTVNHVKRGDLLATLIPADDGKPGIDVCGNLIKQQKVNHLVLKYGNKIAINPEGTKIFSEVNGHVSLVDDRVFVSDTLEIPSDVGPSTGDIVYDGNVAIKGSVTSGYTVNAKGDVSVEGVVEAANIYAGGQIILKRGVQGGGKGYLEAGTNVIAKFIESATVRCGGYLQTDAILHSNVSARGEILVSGKKGFITGGEIHSGSSITAKTAGNSMGTKTTLEVGIDPALVEEFRELEKSIPEMTEELDKLTKIVMNYARRIKNGETFEARVMNNVRESAKRKEFLEQKLEKDMSRYMSLSEDMEENEGGNIIVQGTIYPGCRIIISNVMFFVKSETVHSKFIREGADIKITAI